jgi:hypothetical protein
MTYDWKDYLYVLGIGLISSSLVIGLVWIIAHIPILREIVFGAIVISSFVMGIVSMGAISK